MNIEYKRTTYAKANVVERAQLLVLLRELWFYESFIINKRVLSYDAIQLGNFLIGMLERSESIIIASSSDSPVGFVMGSVDEDNEKDFHISVITINAAFRNKGIGKKLLSFVKSTCGTDMVSLGTLEENVDARRFYETNGFVFNEPPYKVNSAFNVRGIFTVNPK